MNITEWFRRAARRRQAQALRRKFANARRVVADTDRQLAARSAGKRQS